MGGDFNVIKFLDKRQRGDTNARDRDHFNDLIANLDLVDIPLAERQFTWSSVRETPTLAKLHRVFVSVDWESNFNSASTQPIRRPTSDHVSICLCSSELKPKSSRIFIIEKWWLEYEKVHDIIKQS